MTTNVDSLHKEGMLDKYSLSPAKEGAINGLSAEEMSLIMATSKKLSAEAMSTSGGVVGIPI